MPVDPRRVGEAMAASDVQRRRVTLEDRLGKFALQGFPERSVRYRVRGFERNPEASFVELGAGYYVPCSTRFIAGFKA